MRHAEQKPLKQCQIGLTRTVAQSTELRLMLENYGARVWLFPLLEIVPLAGPAELDVARRVLDSQWDYQGLVLTSSNGVRCLAQIAERVGCKLPQRFAHSQIAAVGQKTAEMIRALGLAVHCIPPRFDAESLAETLIAQGVTGQHFLLACGRQSRPILAESLRAAGASVTRLELYDTLLPPDFDPSLLRTQLERGHLDALIFTSPSCVHHLQRALACVNLSQLLAPVKLVSIGPVTSAALRQNLGRVDLEAAEASQEGLLQVILSSELRA